MAHPDRMRSLPGSDLACLERSETLLELIACTGKLPHLAAIALLALLALFALLVVGTP